MAKKMYYTEEETLAKLDITKQVLEEHVRNANLHAYADGARRMYKVDEVDALAGPPAGQEIQLMPASPEGSDVMSLGEPEAQGPPGGKEDTVITTEGISIFDDEDLEIETADPMEKTHVSPSVEDQVLIEGVGSGSGLLDLTRESDDTSLGPGVLDHIDMESAVGSDIAGLEPESAALMREAIISAPPVFVEAVDATAGLFTGIAAACALLVLLLVGMTVAALAGVVPSFMEAMRNNLAFVIVGGIVLAGVFGVVGMLMGKSIAARQEAMRRMSG
ncbi:MAG TPA: hypothetical protein VM098_02630 [Phycisphaerae bacterium]|nr:hypothetical protein [Phycisphaerae bacterium]